MKLFCSTCGNPLKETSTKPLTYCSDNCRNYSKFKNALERSIINLECTRSSVSLIRGDMFRLANLLSNGTKSIKGKE